ncbi:MAG: hypothetical protein FJX70_06690 [Alphaproteobacteria bacterium]|nr:hypothetical protein [Alphaproteobacteria bacterium]
MNVTELIELTNRLSTDKSELTPKERAAYLQYLNMANDELYEIASSGLSSILVNQVVYFKSYGTFKDTGVFALPNDLFKIDGVSVDQVPLKKRNFVTATTVIAPDEYIPYRNLILSNVGSSALKYPTAIDPIDNVTKKYLYITYYPNPKRLVENINDANLETDTPVYPLPYHIFLVHGALYYFYFSNKVFMDKMAYIRNVWEKDKETLAKFKNYGL